VRGTLTLDDLRVPLDIDRLDVFRAWVRELGEDAPRVHYSRGRVWIQVSPQDYVRHLRLVGQVNARLILLAQELDLGQYWPDGGWLTNEHVALSTVPDGLLVLWPTLESGAARFVERPGKGPIELVGRGDMVLEVVSDSSVEKDTVELRASYAAAGVREYWLVDARRQPLVFHLLTLQPDGAYADAERDAEGFLSSPVWGRRFRIDTANDRTGRLTYELIVRP